MGNVTVSPPSDPAPAQAARRGIPKTIWDLIFTFVIPILILQPNLLGEGIGLASLLGEGTAGNIRAYLLASLIPVAYVFWDILVNRNLSPVALFGGAGALVSGALTFWYVDGFWYAIKDSARSYLAAILFFLSAFTAVPLIRVFLDAAAVGENDEERLATQQAMNDPLVGRGLVAGTLAFAGIDLVGGVINSVANYRHVVAKFGSDDFNKQVADVNAVLRIPSLLISLGGVALAMWFIQQAVKKRYGPGASVLEPSKLVLAMRERGELPSVQPVDKL